MRSDQHYGLPTEAINYLRQVKLDICQCCKQPILTETRTIIGNYQGMYGNEYPLYRHFNKETGEYADEFLQANPWSSGPCFFLGLRVYHKNGALLKTYLWSDKEIDNC